MIRLSDSPDGKFFRPLLGQLIYLRTLAGFIPVGASLRNLEPQNQGKPDSREEILAID